MKKSRLSKEARSFINLENLVNSPAARALAGWGQRRAPSMKGVPVKLLRAYTPDYILFHKVALRLGISKLDLMHEIVEPLKERLRKLEEEEASQSG